MVEFPEDLIITDAAGTGVFAVTHVGQNAATVTVGALLDVTNPDVRRKAGNIHVRNASGRSIFRVTGADARLTIGSSLPIIPGTLEVLGSGQKAFLLEGNGARLTIGGNLGGLAGDIQVNDQDGKSVFVVNGLARRILLNSTAERSTIEMRGSTGDIRVGSNGESGRIYVFPEGNNNMDNTNANTVKLDGADGSAAFQDVALFPPSISNQNRDNATIRARGDNGHNASLEVGAKGKGGLISVKRHFNGNDTIVLVGDAPRILVRNSIGDRIALELEGSTSEKPGGKIWLRDDEGNGALFLDGQNGELNLGTIGNSGRMNVKNRFSGNDSITLDGNSGEIKVTGDIILENADFAEEFDAENCKNLEPGVVLTLNEEGYQDSVAISDTAYDRKVVGVYSGAGSYRPGLILDRKPSTEKRRRIPVAMMGKVYCKVDASWSPIKRGDLLVSSDTLGHAMKATDPIRSVGSILGKALKSFDRGKGLVPILAMLQ